MLKMIEEYERLWFLEKIAAAYEKRYGSCPFNVSHWDPSNVTATLLLQALRLPPNCSLTNYTYAYDLSVQKEIIRRLGIKAQDRSCVLVPTGTNSILFAVWWLKSMGIEHLGIICPAYFSVFHSCHLVELPYRRIYMSRQNRKWRFPVGPVEEFIGSMPHTKAVWITNPIYCTGVKQPVDVSDLIHSLMERGVAVVIDECLCGADDSLARYLSGENFLSIFSPHKTICFNGLKFSAMVFDKRHEDFFESWTDVLVGGINSSTATAIHHFCSNNFADLQSAFSSHIDTCRDSLYQMASQFKPYIEVDELTAGHYVTLYAPSIRGNRGKDESFLEQLVFETGALIIPGTMNHFTPNIPLSFRVNLARSSPQLLGAVNRLLHYLASHPDQV